MLTRIDDLTRPLYPHLTADDDSYYLREYTSKAGYEHSETNSIISNLKKSPDRKGKAEWFYKDRDMTRVALELADSFNLAKLVSLTLVPIPPSACKSDPQYDDRMVTILQRMPSDVPLDIRELLLQRTSMEPAHARGKKLRILAPSRPSVDELLANYEIDTELVAPRPRSILLFDDVLTTGAHFVAAKRRLKSYFPDCPISGIFIARRIFTPETQETIDDTGDWSSDP